ncbi:N-acetylmuramoyl-L-alanine amidase [Asanoa sp. WMMD1127]|uniref:N-acetylmuramoyl-L-alanine amidase n=1 Tax=Asanoa sp. WMMD1127 TaxID=3016107 RepID=UPI002417E506|nr:N-acetylmuramoyl-L-alanine amidase [Asanoa sp. WMMD1127]MDG4825870.1 N-acetylmuramoyl-L-alanine amidase [Asanoa sp. WMMD1127]
MVRPALVAVVTAAALVLGAAGPAAATGPNSSLDSAFSAASARYGVPRDVLVALGWAQSRLDQRAAGRTGACGVMQLTDDGATRTLPEATALTGLSRAELCGGAVANASGAAAVLRSYADQEGLDRAARSDANRWYVAVARFAGAVDDGIARLYADTVFDHLAAGFAGPPRLAPRAVAPVRGRLADVPAWGSAGPRSPDHPEAVWSPAHKDNFAVADREKSHPIDFVVIHVTQGAYAGTLAWFKNPRSEVSAHYTVRSTDGALAQSVREKDIAWHAGNKDYNARSIGIEHEGFVDNPAWFTDAMYRESAALTRALTRKYKIPRDRAHIVAHREVPGADHTDPGPHWNWTYYLQLVNGVWGKGTGTAGARLNVRGGPGTGHPVVGTVAKGAKATIWCQRAGSRVTGTYGTSTVWDRIGTNRWVAHSYLKTGHPGFIPGVPRC